MIYICYLFHHVFYFYGDTDRHEIRKHLYDDQYIKFLPISWGSMFYPILCTTQYLNDGEGYWRSSCLYLRCVYFRIVVSNTYCVVICGGGGLPLLYPMLSVSLECSILIAPSNWINCKFELLLSLLFFFCNQNRFSS